MPSRLIPVLLVVAIAQFGAGCGSNETGARGSDGDAFADDTPLSDNWVGSWATAPYGPYPGGPLAGTVPEPFDSLTTPTAFPDEQAFEQSFRMIVHPTLAGDRVRIRLSNLMGEQAVQFGAVRIALRAANAAIIPGTDVALTFSGEPELSLEPGAEAISDGVDFSFQLGDDIAISFYIRDASGPMTWHAVSFDTQYVTPQGAGNVTTDPTGGAFSETTVGWFFVSGLDVLRTDALGAIVALGDSITDGAYQVPATNTRWPDLLAQRLQAADIPMGVLNEGINSNTVTAIRSGPNTGQGAVVRFERDVLDRAGVRSLVILEGTNDLTSGASAADVIEALGALVDRAHTANLCVVLATITPRDDVTFGWDRATMEAERQAINVWIRDMANNGAVEGLADFDSVMGAIDDPTYPNPLLYFPDLLHPNSLGFNAMANQVPIEALAPPPVGTCAPN